MNATRLRHSSTVIDLHERLTVVTGLDQAAADQLLAALGRGDAALEFEADRVALDYRPPPMLRFSDATPPSPDGSSDAALQAAIEVAESAFADAKTAVEVAEAAYTAAQDELLALRRDADREAPAALDDARRRLEAAQEGAAEARRALSAARDESSVREADLEAVRTLEQRRERLQAARDEIAARLLRMPAAVDVEPIATALEGLRRLRDVKPRPMARAVEIADRLQEIAGAMGEMEVESPPEWLVTPALDALRTAKVDLDALESGKPTVAVDPEKVRAVEAAHERLLEAEAKVMDKGSRSNRRRLDEAAAAEREALHALGLSSYDQFLKYLAPTLDAGAREERLTEARAAVGDAETVWAELHGGSVPEGWTELHLEQAALVDEAKELLGRDVDPAGLDEALRGHLETVVDTTWAEDALAEALAAANTPLGSGGIEAAAERVIAEAPAAREERDQAEAEMAEIDAELAAIAEELAELVPASALDSGAGGGGAGDATDGPPHSLAELEQAANAADAALAEAQQAVEAAEGRVAKSEAVAAQEQAAAGKAETAKDAVGIARDRLAQADQALVAARAAASEGAAAADAAAKAAAARSAGERLQARLLLLGRAAANRAAGQPLVIGGTLSALGDPDDVVAMLRQLAAGVQVVVFDATGSITELAGVLGNDGRLVRL